MKFTGVGRRAAGILLSLCLVAPVVGIPPSVNAATLPAGFQETTVISGLTSPTVVRFSSDGRVFVGEKSGIIKVFDSLSDTAPTVFADLRTKVHDFWDRGLLGMALAPDFPADPYVYVLYSYDHILNDSVAAPRWGDQCPTPPGATGDGCVISGRLSRLQATGNTSGSEQVLIEDWCQQYPSHSIGSLAFGADGALYVSGGDGASFNFADYGQDGSPLNPCGDPPAAVGGAQTSPTAEGGALRSQDVRTTSDPTSLDGAILRVNPATGAGMPGNPFANSTDLNARRIVGYGYRNPFRIAIRPGTNEVWTGDVGWSTWEELNRLVTPADATADNFGWPCYEGDGRQGSYDALNLSLCENLYAAGSGAIVAPYYTYRHSNSVVSGEACNNGQGSSTVGMAFYAGGDYPDTYDGALFFADYSRDCLWVMPAGANGLPNPSARANFVTPAANPVHLEIGPAGDLFYVDFTGGKIQRIKYFVANQPPTASFTTSPTSGPTPLSVTFDGTASSDPEGDGLTYAWDLDGDLAFDDAWTATTSRTYPSEGNVSVRLQVTDPSGATHVSPATIVAVGNDPPTAVIDTATTPWVVDQTIAFSGHATDPEQGTLAASRLSWEVVLMHCPQDCHEHPLQTISGVASGSFAAPDHAYPAHLELRLTATDSLGLSDTAVVELDPTTVDLSFVTSPAGLDLTVGGATEAAPFTRRVIVGSANSLSADSPQTVGSVSYDWTGWSDAGAQSHDITAPAVASTYTATYAAPGSPTLNSIAVTPANPSIAAGATQQFTATGTYSDASTANLTSSVTWASANTAAATINSTGLATGVAAGTSSIGATLGAISGSTTLTVTASGPTTFTLSGTVTAGGPGLTGAAVHAFDATTNAFFGTSVTTAGGAFSFSLPAGNYKLFVQPDEPGYADQWKGGSSFASATSIALSSNTTGVPFPLVGAFTLSGTVTAGGPGLTGAAVHAFDATTNAFFGTSVTTAGGAFSFSLPAGNYKLFVQPDEPGYADQWKGGSSFASATSIALSSNTTGVPFPLVGAFTLSGTVTAGGPGLTGAAVHAFDATTNAFFGTSVTTAGGAFSFSLPAGNYKLFVQPDEPGYADQWKGGSSFASATSIALSSNTTGVPFPLVGAFTLSGTVTAGGPGLTGAAVHAFDATTNAFFGTSVTTAGGAFSFSLPAGNYKLFVQPDEPGYADQWKGGSSFASATSIALSSNTTGVPFPLVGAFTLSGTVTAGGPGLTGAAVHAFDATTNAFFGTSVTTAGGAFSFSLPAGNYKLFVQPDEPGYADQWKGGSSFASATSIALSSNTTGVPFPLVGAFTLSGTVTAGGPGLTGAAVHAFDATTNAFFGTSVTTAGGAFSFSLPAGNYKLFVQPDEPGYADQWKGGSSFASATSIALSSNTTGVPFPLVGP